MAVNVEKMTAEIDLMKNNKLYMIKDGKIIKHDLPDYGETIVITLGGKLEWLETTVKRKV